MRIVALSTGILNLSEIICNELMMSAWAFYHMLLVVSNELLFVKFACYFHLSGSFCFGDSFWFGMLVRHAHYQTGITPLALVWKDENCSQYVMDTDSKGQVPNQQQVLSHASFVSSHCLAFHAFSLLYIYLNCLLL